MRKGLFILFEGGEKRGKVPSSHGQKYILKKKGTKYSRAMNPEEATRRFAKNFLTRKKKFLRKKNLIFSVKIDGFMYRTSYVRHLRKEKLYCWTASNLLPLLTKDMAGAYTLIPFAQKALRRAKVFGRISSSCSMPTP